MKIQAELENFQDQLENSVLCKTFLFYLSSTKRDQLKNLKMHLNDTITNFPH